MGRDSGIGMPELTFFSMGQAVLLQVKQSEYDLVHNTIVTLKLSAADLSRCYHRQFISGFPKHCVLCGTFMACFESTRQSTFVKLG